MPNINVAIQWAIETANDDRHGYSQANRYGPDYDCSSFVAAALIAGGFNVPATMWTGNERSCLLAAGFTEIPPGTPPQGGDICMTHITGGTQHTGMYVSSTQFAQASADYDGVTGDSSGREIWIGNFPSSAGWQYMFRWYGQNGNYTARWHTQATGAFPKSSTEAIENALMAYDVLSARGWTLEAFCGMWGNVGYEGGYNPWRWESDYIPNSNDTTYISGSHGYGLMGYTPASRYCYDSYPQSLPGYGVNYSDITGSVNDGTAQLIFCDTTSGYYPTTSYPETWTEYRESHQSPAYLAKAWLYNYERPANPASTEEYRANEATYWYGLLQTLVGKKRRMPIWMYLRPQRRV